MNRRGFFGAAAGLACSPALGALPLSWVTPAPMAALDRADLLWLRLNQPRFACLFTALSPKERLRLRTIVSPYRGRQRYAVLCHELLHTACYLLTPAAP